MSGSCKFKLIDKNNEKKLHESYIRMDSGDINKNFENDIHEVISSYKHGGQLNNFNSFKRVIEVS